LREGEEKAGLAAKESPEAAVALAGKETETPGESRKQGIETLKRNV